MGVIGLEDGQLYACITNIRITPDKKKGVEKWTHMIEVEKRADLLKLHKFVAHSTKGGLGRKIHCDCS